GGYADTCWRGTWWEVACVIRGGPPSIGRWEAVRLSAVDRRAVCLAEGLGHGFCALTDGATVAYLCSTVYRPAAEHTVDPLDGRLGIPWPVAEPVLSERDATAPGLADAPLPAYADWLARYRRSPAA